MQSNPPFPSRIPVSPQQTGNSVQSRTMSRPAASVGRRLAFNCAAALSSIICLASLALWVHSTQKMDRFRSTTAARRITFHSKEGVIYIDITTAPMPTWTPGYQHIHSLPTQFKPPTPSWEIAGLGSGSDTPELHDAGIVHRRFVQIPLWPIVVLTSVLPVLWFDARARRAAATPNAPDNPSSKSSFTSSSRTEHPA
jgi:hypothetical protein